MNYHICALYELRAEEGGGLIIHHGLIIRTIRYVYVYVITSAKV